MNNYFIYALLDTRVIGQFEFEKFKFDFEPFYIGKSKNQKRPNEHIKKALRNEKSLKSNIIRKIIASGNVVKVIKVVENLTEDQANEYEKKLILLIGRRDICKGTLTNHTDGGDGNSGIIFTEEYRKKLSISSKKMWQNPEYIEKRNIALKQAFKDNPESSVAKSNFLKKWHQENKEKVSGIRKKQWENEEYRKKMYESRKEMVKDDSYIEKMKEVHKKLGEKSRKKFIITYPDGHEEVIDWLEGWCKNNDIIMRTFKAYINYNKSFKGFYIRRTDCKELKIKCKGRGNSYKIYFNDKVEIVSNLKVWCDDHAIKYQAILRLKDTNKVLKGYRIESHINKEQFKKVSIKLSESHQSEVYLENIRDKSSKYWKIIFLTGECIIVKNLKLWCNNNNLVYGSVVNCRTRFFKNRFKIEKIEKEFD